MPKTTARTRTTAKSPTAKKSADKSSSIRSPVKRVASPKKSGEGEMNVSVRKIENGYIVREETFNKRGDYKTKETFTEVAPKIEIQKRGK